MKFLEWRKPIESIRVIDSPVHAYPHLIAKVRPLSQVPCKGSFKVCPACWVHVMVFRKSASRWFRRKR